jgi:hypothetical protein
MSYKKCARIFGVVLLLIGILGCLPGLTTNGHFLGIFHVNNGTNALHIVTGLIAYVFSHGTLHASQLFFQVFGIFYGVIGILGFGYRDNDIFGLFANNLSESFFHLIVCIMSLYLGFLYKNVRNT